MKESEAWELVGRDVERRSEIGHRYICFYLNENAGFWLGLSLPTRNAMRQRFQSHLEVDFALRELPYRNDNPRSWYGEEGFNAATMNPCRALFCYTMALEAASEEA